MQRGGLRGSRCDNDGVFEGVIFLEDLDNVGDGGSLLSNGHIDAVQLLFFFLGIEVLLLVDDGIDGNGSLSGLSVSNDEFSLASTNGHL